MEETKIIKAYCSKSKKYFGLELASFGSSYKVVNMIPLTADEARYVASEIRIDKLDTNDNLIPCSRCGSRRVSDCKCAKKLGNCSTDMGYQFQCIYCENLEMDYSSIDRSVIDEIAGDTITLSQGKEIKVITFSNVEWQKFDNIQFHQPALMYREPKIHVDANEEKIEFHGYNISQMDEGVFYMIGKNDDFEIECDVNTTTISPHPGGHFYVSFGAISAQITQLGGSFYLGGNAVASVGARFKMKLCLSDGGKFEIYIDGTKRGELFSPVTARLKITFGFTHPAHHCDLLSHAYISGIKMKQGISKQQ